VVNEQVIDDEDAQRQLEIYELPTHK